MNDVELDTGSMHAITGALRVVGGDIRDAASDFGTLKTAIDDQFDGIEDNQSAAESEKIQRLRN